MQQWNCLRFSCCNRQPPRFRIVLSTVVIYFQLRYSDQYYVFCNFQVCCICLSRYADADELRELPCSHFFHTECVDKWLKINACCPLCKFEISNSNENSPSAADSNQQVWGMKGFELPGTLMWFFVDRLALSTGNFPSLQLILALFSAIESGFVQFESHKKSLMKLV